MMEAFWAQLELRFDPRVCANTTSVGAAEAEEKLLFLEIPRAYYSYDPYIT